MGGQIIHQNTPDRVLLREVGSFLLLYHRESGSRYWELALLAGRLRGERVFIACFWGPAGVFLGCFRPLFDSPLGPDLTECQARFYRIFPGYFQGLSNALEIQHDSL